MVDEKDIMVSRLQDLARRRDSGDYCLFSPFLTPDLTPVVKSIRKTVLWGGYADAERKVAAFLPDYIDEPDVDWPIAVIAITPTDGKKYSHRDYLGSLMSLGIKRQVLGDIIIGERSAYLFCLEKIVDFVSDNLTQVAGATVKVEKSVSLDDIPDREYEDICGSVAAERLDCIVALAIKTSRTKSAGLISSGNVMVNNQEAVKTTYILKNGDRISIRGKGKFIYDGITGNTKKSRLVAKLRKYI